MPSSPYAHHLVGRDSIDVMRSSLDDYREATRRLTPELWQRPWAPGKWTVREVIVHVAQWEMILGMRMRCAVAAPDYTVQPFDQDELMRLEGGIADGPTALEAFDAVRRMNIAVAASLSAADRRKRVGHLEYGEIDVEFILETIAGHGVHHWKQIAPLV